MGNRKLNGYRIDGGEIEFVAMHPKDHTLPYVKAVREACYRRYLRSWRGEKESLRLHLKRLDRAIDGWDFELKDGRLIPAGPACQRDQDSGVVGEV